MTTTTFNEFKQEKAKFATFFNNGGLVLQQWWVSGLVAAMVGETKFVFTLTFSPLNQTWLEIRYADHVEHFMPSPTTK